MGSVDWGVMWYAIPYMAKGTLITLEICSLAMIAGCIIVYFVRGTPALVQVFLVYFALPVIGIDIQPFWGGVVALAFNAGGFISEIVRAGLQSIDAGQSEAAIAIGMTNRQRLLYVLLPQSLRRITPPLTNELIALVKGSSLLSAISIFELTRSTQVIIAQRFTPFELYALLAVFYLIIISPLARLSEYVEEKLS
jgi:ABC-type amino acid transport system permease subunit